MGPWAPSSWLVVDNVLGCEQGQCRDLFTPGLSPCQLAHSVGSVLALSCRKAEYLMQIVYLKPSASVLWGLLSVTSLHPRKQNKHFLPAQAKLCSYFNSQWPSNCMCEQFDENSNTSSLSWHVAWCLNFLLLAWLCPGLSGLPLTR